MKLEKGRIFYETNKKGKKETPQLKLATAILEFNTTPNDPDALWRFKKKYWDVYGEIVGKKINVDQPTFTSEKIKELRNEGKKIDFYPQGITNTDFGKIFPGILGGINGRNIKVVDPTPQYGWFEADSGLLAPRLNKTPEGIRDELKAKDRMIISLNQLAIITNSSYLFERIHLDTTTFTHIRDKAINNKNGYPSKTTSFHAAVYGEGNFDIRLASKNFHGEMVGIRTVGKL